MYNTNLNIFLESLQYYDPVKWGLNKMEPEIYQELLQWYFWDNILIFIFQLLLATLSLASLVQVRRHITTWDQANPKNVRYIISLVLFLLFLSSSMVPLYNAIKVTIAPRIILLQELKNLKR